MKLWTYLCPSCDGWGVIDVDDRHPGDPAHDPGEDCLECAGTGVIRAAARRNDLHRWTGNVGRQRCRNRSAHVDPLQLVARGRLYPSRSAAFDTYLRWKQDAFRPVLAKLSAAEERIVWRQRLPVKAPFDTAGFAHGLMAGDQRAIAAALGYAA